MPSKTLPLFDPSIGFLSRLALRWAALPRFLSRSPLFGSPLRAIFLASALFCAWAPLPTSAFLLALTKGSPADRADFPLGLARSRHDTLPAFSALFSTPLSPTRASPTPSRLTPPLPYRPQPIEPSMGQIPFYDVFDRLALASPEMSRIRSLALSWLRSFEESTLLSACLGEPAQPALSRRL